MSRLCLCLVITGLLVTAATAVGARTCLIDQSGRTYQLLVPGTGCTLGLIIGLQVARGAGAGWNALGQRLLYAGGACVALLIVCALLAVPLITTGWVSVTAVLAAWTVAGLASLPVLAGTITVSWFVRLGLARVRGRHHRPGGG